MSELDQVPFDILSPEEEHKTLMGMLDLYDKLSRDMVELDNIVIELFGFVTELWSNQ